MDAARIRRLDEIEDTHFWFAGRRVLVEQLLREELARGRRRILDVGCGTGRLLDALSADHDVTGVDASPAAVAVAQARAPQAAVLQAPAEELPFPDASFDVAVILDVLEHVDDTVALSEVARVLRAGSCALVSVPAMPRLWSFRDSAAGHRRRYTRKTLRRLVAGRGLQLEALRPYQCLLAPLAVATRLLGRRGPALRDFEDAPPGWLNRALSVVNRGEARLGARVPLPFGTTLVALCRKPLAA